MKWVLIDLSYLAHRARYATRDLEYEDIPTGIIYGFFEQLYSICKTSHINSNKVLIFTDSKKSYRSRTYPDYKKKRREQRTEEEQEQLNIMYKQINKLKNKILPQIGFPVYKQVGLESDDLIAWAAKELTRKNENGVIITSDGDLYQCITSCIHWYDPGKELLMNKKTFLYKKGIETKLWGEVKALAGCSSDCVPGLKNIGEKTAIKWLKGEAISDKRRKIIEQGKIEIKMWRKLTVLPHKKTKPFELHIPKYDSKMFFKFCKQYHILSYFKSKKRLQWIKFFKGTFKGRIKRRKRK